MRCTSATKTTFATSKWIQWRLQLIAFLFHGVCLCFANHLSIAIESLLAFPKSIFQQQQQQGATCTSFNSVIIYCVDQRSTFAHRSDWQQLILIIYSHLCFQCFFANWSHQSECWSSSNWCCCCCFWCEHNEKEKWKCFVSRKIDWKCNSAFEHFEETTMITALTQWFHSQPVSSSWLLFYQIFQ